MLPNFPKLKHTLYRKNKSAIICTYTVKKYLLLKLLTIYYTTVIMSFPIHFWYKWISMRYGETIEFYNKPAVMGIQKYVLSFEHMWTFYFSITL